MWLSKNSQWYRDNFFESLELNLEVGLVLESELELDLESELFSL